MRHRICWADSQRLRQQLELLGFDSYRAFLSSDLWRGLTSRLRKNPDYQRCQHCRARSVIHFHHTSYASLLDIRLIIPLCGPCHKGIHDRVIKTAQSVKKATKKQAKVKGIRPVPTQLHRDKRVLSIRICRNSGLPATLHHSLQSILPPRVKSGTVQDRLDKWLARKRRRNDQIMLTLYEGNKAQVNHYIAAQISDNKGVVYTDQIQEMIDAQDRHIQDIMKESG